MSLRCCSLACALASVALALDPALAVDPALARPPARAHLAGTVAVAETAHMHLVSHHGTQLLNETSTGSGTFHCPIAVRLSIASAHANISFSIACSSRDTITGGGGTSYYASGSTAHFSGNVSVTHGTGRYAHVSASGLLVKGILQRGSYALSLSVSGQMRL